MNYIFIWIIFASSITSMYFNTCIISKIIKIYLSNISSINTNCPKLFPI